MLKHQEGYEKLIFVSLRNLRHFTTGFLKKTIKPGDLHHLIYRTIKILRHYEPPTGQKPSIYCTRKPNIPLTTHLGYYASKPI